MSEILFIIGAGIMLVGELRLGTIHASGVQVRVAGFLLILPIVIRYFLGFVVASLMDDPADIVGAVEFLAIFAATGMAYGLIYRASGSQLGDLFNIEVLTNQDKINKVQDESEEKKDENANERPIHSQQAQPKTPPRPRPNRPTPIRRTPSNANSVLSLGEAANYLNISEPALIKLINDGEIPAARINYRYKISKAVLDEFIKKQQDGEV